VRSGLQLPVPEGPAGKENLKQVMKDIGDVRKRMEVTQAMFEPLKETVQLLKNHGVDIASTEVSGKDVQDYLEEAPMAWDSLVKKSFKKKEEILPLQMIEVESLKEEIDDFDTSVRDFRQQFKREAPYNFEGRCQDAYKKMDEWASKLM